MSLGVGGSDGNGGGIDSRTTTLDIDNVSITDNQAGMSGGGCSFVFSEDSVIKNSTICGNTPDQTSGVFDKGTGNSIGTNCSACEADFSGDGVVDGADFGMLLAAWGACSGCQEDINGDDFVDGADVGLFLSLWGPCP